MVKDKKYTKNLLDSQSKSSQISGKEKGMCYIFSNDFQNQHKQRT